VHFAVFPGDGSVLVEDDGRIVIQSRSPAFKKRCNENDTRLTGDLAVKVGRRPRNGFGPVETFGIFGLAEIQAVMQFLEYYKLGALLGVLCRL